MRARFGALLMVGMAGVSVVPVTAETLKGDDGDNRLVGTPRADILSGRGGDDLLRGNADSDRLLGGSGHDDIDGGPGRDRINGGRGFDVLNGGEGADLIVGGRRADQINMLDGAPRPSPGRDVIKAKDGERDEINCGAGHDRVFVDRVEDGVYDCEEVIEP